MREGPSVLCDYDVVIPEGNQIFLFSFLFSGGPAIKIESLIQRPDEKINILLKK
jgi:hypothetical protein